MKLYRQTTSEFALLWRSSGIVLHTYIICIKASLLINYQDRIQIWYPCECLKSRSSFYAAVKPGDSLHFYFQGWDTFNTWSICLVSMYWIIPEKDSVEDTSSLHHVSWPVITHDSYQLQQWFPILIECPFDMKPGFIDRVEHAVIGWIMNAHGGVTLICQVHKHYYECACEAIYQCLSEYPGNKLMPKNNYEVGCWCSRRISYYVRITTEHTSITSQTAVMIESKIGCKHVWSGLVTTSAWTNILRWYYHKPIIRPWWGSR